MNRRPPHIPASQEERGVKNAHRPPGGPRNLRSSSVRLPDQSFPFPLDDCCRCCCWRGASSTSSTQQHHHHHHQRAPAGAWAKKPMLWAFAKDGACHGPASSTAFMPFPLPPAPHTHTQRVAPLHSSLGSMFGKMMGALKGPAPAPDMAGFKDNAPSWDQLATLLASKQTGAGRRTRVCVCCGCWC